MVLLGVRSEPTDKLSVINLNVNLEENVGQFKNKVSGEINLPTDSFDLIYCGCLLENDSKLDIYGLKSYSMIHVVKRDKIKDASSNPAQPNASEVNVDMLTSIFKSFIGNPLLELAMRRLTKRADVIENIISSSPGLSEDAVAIAILQDPNLIVHFTNPESLKKIAKLHPALLEAAHHIASAVHDEAHNFAASSATMNSSSLSNAQNSGNSYSLENLSDDEDSSQSSDSTQPSNSTNQSRTNSTLSAEFFAALSRAVRSTSGESNNTASSTPSVSRSNSNSNGVITFEMFYQAMQQAFASSPVTNNPESTAQSTPSSAFSDISQNSSDSNNMQRQITIMHEMGLQNDAVNIQALQITNGDVQAAIELVLSGFGDN